MIPALYFGTNHGGIRGTAISHAIVVMVVAVPLAAYFLERIGVRLAGMRRDLARLGLAAALAAGACLVTVAAVHGPPWLDVLTSRGVSGIVVYLAIATPAAVRVALDSGRASSVDADSRAMR